MEGLKLKVLEQHKRYGPAPLTCTRKESGCLPSLSESGLATAHLDEFTHQGGRREVTLPLGHSVLLFPKEYNVATGSSC
jgi:hypothetical protein